MDKRQKPSSLRLPPVVRSSRRRHSDSELFGMAHALRRPACYHLALSPVLGSRTSSLHELQQVEGRTEPHRLNLSQQKTPDIKLPSISPTRLVKLSAPTAPTNDTTVFPAIRRQRRQSTGLLFSPVNSLAVSHKPTVCRGSVLITSPMSPTECLGVNEPLFFLPSIQSRYKNTCYHHQRN